MCCCAGMRGRLWLRASSSPRWTTRRSFLPGSESQLVFQDPALPHSRSASVMLRQSVPLQRIRHCERGHVTCIFWWAYSFLTLLSSVLHCYLYLVVSVHQCSDALLVEAHLRVQCMSYPISPPRIGGALAGAIYGCHIQWVHRCTAQICLSLRVAEDCHVAAQPSG